MVVADWQGEATASPMLRWMLLQIDTIGRQQFPSRAGWEIAASPNAD